MKKSIALCLSLILTIILGACSQSSTTSTKAPYSQTLASTTTPSKSTSAATSGVISVKITPPSGWKQNTESVLPVHYMKNTASFMVKIEKFSSKTVDGVVEEAKKAFDKAFDNVSYIGNAQSINIDGFDARKITFTCTVSKMKMKYQYVYLIAGGDVYAITFGDLESSFDSLTADYSKILTDISLK